MFADALGDAAREPEKRPATLETIYDLASLTKPLVTGLLCARLVERGALSIDDRVAEYLPEFNREDKREHHDQTPAERTPQDCRRGGRIYLLAQDKADALAAIAEQPLEYPPGERVVYSDLGFIVLGFLLQRVSGRSLPELAQDEIFDPLELSTPSSILLRRCAPASPLARPATPTSATCASATLPDRRMRAGAVELSGEKSMTAMRIFSAARRATPGFFQTRAKRCGIANQFIGELSAIAESGDL